MFAKNITIYNVKRNKTTNLDEYKRTLLSGVHFENEDGIKLGDKNISTENVAIVVFPLLNESFSNYLSPKDYKNSTDVTGKWTVQNGDLVVLNEIDLDIVDVGDLKGYDARTVKSFELVDYALIESLNNITINLK